jgi:ribosomal protein S18 acetylase RimI-like enzyme
VYRALHDHVVAAVEADPGVCGVRLYVEPENETARATYRALGMVETYRVMELPRRG